MPKTVTVLNRHIALTTDLKVAVGETVTLLHPPLHLVVVSIEMTRECQQIDSLADGYLQVVSECMGAAFTHCRSVTTGSCGLCRTALPQPVRMAGVPCVCFGPVDGTATAASFLTAAH